jgi:putative membrane protein
VPVPGQEPPHQASAADQLFALEAALDVMAELDAARVAQAQAQSAPVKQFAARMLDEHAKSRARLQAMAGASHVPMVSSLDSAHQRMLEELGGLHGGGFDLSYVRTEVAAHQRAAELYEWIISSGQDPGVKSYAAEVLPAVLEHLEAAQILLAQLEPGSGSG